MRIHTHHGKDVFLIRFQMLYRTHIIILSIFLFSLGVLFQLKGDFGDPYFQQIICGDVAARGAFCLDLPLPVVEDSPYCQRGRFATGK